MQLHFLFLILSYFLVSAYTIQEQQFLRVVGDNPTAEHIVVFCHGFFANAKHAYNYLDGYMGERGTIPHSLVTFDFPEVAHEMQFIDRSIATIGQWPDIYTIHAVLKWVRYTYPTRKIILYGVSRGASAIINYLGNEKIIKPTGIEAVILESPFVDLRSVVRTAISRFYLDKFPKGTAISYWLLRKIFPGHLHRGPHPIQYITKFPHTIPVLFIAGKSDQLICYRDSQRLATKLRASGHPKVTWVLLPDGNHGALLWGKSGEQYQAAVRTFYKQHITEMRVQNAIA